MYLRDAKCPFCGEMVFPGEICRTPGCIQKAEALRLKEKLEYRANNINRVMLNAGIPKKFVGLVSDRKYSDLLDRGVYLWGKPGTGKTVLACTVAREHLLAGRDVKFVSVPSLVLSLQDIARRGEGSYYDRLIDLARQDVLLFDDLGAEKTTDFARQALYFVINEREQFERTTLLTSNFSLDEIDARGDGVIASRLAGICRVIELTGPDRRVEVSGGLTEAEDIIRADDPRVKKGRGKNE